MIKCSDERNRMNSIITTIGEESGRKIVVKEAVYPEGAFHLRDVLTYHDILEKTYAPAKACPVEFRDGRLVFEFIEGESLEDRYRRAAAEKDKETFRCLLQEHRALLYANAENETVFHGGSDFVRKFGDPSPYEGKPGFRISNYDAIAGNILYTDAGPVFIDYEWVMTFPMPQDEVVFHCVRDLYYHIRKLEEFYPLQDAMKELGVETDLDTLQKSYRHFWKDVVSEENGESFALSKALLMKKNLTVPELLEKVQETNRQLRADLDQAADGWKKSSESAEYANRMWKECAQAVSELNSRMNSQEKMEADIRATVQGQFDVKYADLMKEYQKLNSDRDIWKNRYQAVVSTKSWRAVNKVRKAIHKGE
jgi:hypothetical protein